MSLIHDLLTYLPDHGVALASFFPPPTGTPGAVVHPTADTSDQHVVHITWTSAFTNIPMPDDYMEIVLHLVTPAYPDSRLVRTRSGERAVEVREPVR